MSGKLADRAEDATDRDLVDIVHVAVECAIQEVQRRGDINFDREASDLTEVCTRRVLDHLERAERARPTPRAIAEVDFDTVLTALRAAGGLAAKESESIGRPAAGHSA